MTLYSAIVPPSALLAERHEEGGRHQIRGGAGIEAVGVSPQVGIEPFRGLRALGAPGLARGQDLPGALADGTRGRGSSLARDERVRNLGQSAKVALERRRRPAEAARTCALQSRDGQA